MLVRSPRTFPPPRGKFRLFASASVADNNIAFVNRKVIVTRAKELNVRLTNAQAKLRKVSAE